MNQTQPECQNLTISVDTLLQLLHQEPSLRLSQDTTTVQASLRKAISPKFEIVFAGAFSAGKSMLINALLERELLYSAEGHATGTECRIEYAEPNAERVVLTFLSLAEIQTQAVALCQYLGVELTNQVSLNQPDVIGVLRKGAETIIQLEGGETKSDRAKQAKALIFLLDGFEANKEYIHASKNNTYSMEQLKFNNLKEAASYARRGRNSAVLKRIEYYCYHSLLQDGNILIDLPGIDAPVKKDAELSYEKIADEETSAVVCVLKPASEGEMTTEETEMLEKIRDNAGIRDRVFYVFNRIDDTWYNTQLRRRLDDLINTQFRDSSRTYKTSALLGFYGSQIKQTSLGDRFGLDSVFAASVTPDSDSEEETPQFVYAFNNYCSNSRKLPSQFRISVNSYETPNQNYLRILSEWGNDLINQLIQDSGIEDFRQGITRYLTQEKRPQLFASLANDLQPICLTLQQGYLQQYRAIDSQPREIQGIKSRRIEMLNQELQRLGSALSQHISQEVNQIITNDCRTFEDSFRKLKVKMVSKLDELLKSFSVEQAYKLATASHPRNSTAPLLAILVEAFYYLSNQLEDVLAAAAAEVITTTFAYLNEQIRRQDYYRDLSRLIGSDAGIETALDKLESQIQLAIRAAASAECDRFVRESPRFYDEGTFSIYQFRQVLQQTSQGYDALNVIQAEDGIRELLKLDFEPKVGKTIASTFRQTINQIIKTELLPLAKTLEDGIMQQYNRARSHVEKTLEQEAQEQLIENQNQLQELRQKIGAYNQAVTDINQCLSALNLARYQLPTVDLAAEESPATPSQSPAVEF
ncbi:MAG TPA: dynamin-like GTPase family protein [Oscillatoriaceae cyanobacterium M33_DOE_052]|uniref:Dynamin family protein n=1 Tax=Planktothricoides sp. SpSt-374 TaxID=2282167 RepID=A0A7C3VJZ4_9CYAN|nr:dynamin-like GTPase family protein [Oscillatoriaceae cyanobacterium M33_DOE_052]